MRKGMEIQYIPLDKIDVSVLNARKHNVEEKIEELARSIEAIGLQQPIVVYKKEKGRYELIIGQRRFYACKKLNWKEIPAIVTSVKDDTEALVKSFSENIHRVELDYKDKMRVAVNLYQRLGSVEKVAEYLGVSPQTVRNYLGYAGVPEPIKKLVSQGKLGASTALRIASRIANESLAIEIAKKVVEIPRSEHRIALIDIAAENPDKPLEELVKKVQERASMRKITVHITQRVYDAIVTASKEYKTDKENLVKEVIEKWLIERGYIK